jgi:hypothetical protein
MTLVMPGVAHGHSEVMMMYVGLKNGCRMIWGKLCIFSVSYNAHGVTSPHDHISEIADNLFQTLMSPRYKNTFHCQIAMLGQM